MNEWEGVEWRLSKVLAANRKIPNPQAPNGREAKKPSNTCGSLGIRVWSGWLEISLRRDLALHPGGGVLGEFSSVFQIELPFDLLAILFNGLDTQVQFFRNITRFLPLPDQLEHFQLPVAKPLYRGFIDIVLTADLLLE